MLNSIHQFPGGATTIPRPHLCLSSAHPKKPCPNKPQQIRCRHNSDYPPNDAVTLSKEDRAELLELALVRNRSPQFPGSVYARKPHTKDPSTPPLAVLLKPDKDEDLLVRAVEIRRKVTLEIFVDELRRKGKFGITYAANLSAEVGEFLDLVMVEAAYMKKDSEFVDSSFNFRARRFIQECNVVGLVRWFKHNSLSYHQIGRLICMSRGKLHILLSRAEWLKSIHVKGRFIGVVLIRVGETILWRREEELDDIVGYLVRCGVRMDWMGFIMGRCSELLAFSMEEVETRVRFFTDMGMNKNDFGTMVYDCPKVLGFFSLEEMKEKVEYLKEFGLGNEDVGRLLAFKPQLMVCSIEERWKPLIKFFYYLGIDKAGLKRMLVIKPAVFCVDLEATIVPKVRFLQDLGIKNEAIGRMLVKFPPVLTYSLYKKIRPVIVFLLAKAGVTQKNIPKVISLAPELLGCSIAHKLDGHVKYFLSLGITLRQLGEMIADFPMLLRYNVDLHRPKYRYLRRIMVRPLNELIEFPRFFSYSLEKRIAPRHKVMVENRVNFKLRYMLSGSEDEFLQRVKDAVERRQIYEAGVVSIFASEKADAEDECENVYTDEGSGDGVEDARESGVDETEDVYTDSETETDEDEDEFSDHNHTLTYS